MVFEKGVGIVYEPTTPQIFTFLKWLAVTIPEFISHKTCVG